MTINDVTGRHLDYQDYANNSYRIGDRYDVDSAKVIRSHIRKTESKWQLVLLIIPLLALGLWGVNNFRNINHSAITSTTSQSNQNIPQSGVGGGPAGLVTPAITRTNKVILNSGD